MVFFLVATVHKLLMKVIVKTKFVLTKYKEFLLGLKCTPVWRSGSPPSSSQWNQTTSYLTRSHATLFNLSLRPRCGNCFIINIWNSGSLSLNYRSGKNIRHFNFTDRVNPSSVWLIEGPLDRWFICFLLNFNRKR